LLLNPVWNKTQPGLILSMRFLFIAFFFSVLTGHAQPKTDPLMQAIFAGNQNPLFQAVIGQPEKYRLQVIYTRIDRDRNNKPRFSHYYFNYDPLLYFNPASMVKMPLAFLSLEKLYAIGKKEINRHTTIVFDSSRPWHRPLYRDTTSVSSLPNLAHFIKRALLISENDPYNRMYQWVGQEAINRVLHRKGYPEVRITRQFMGLTLAQNRVTPPVRLLDRQGNPLYLQPEQSNQDSFDFSQTILLGKAHLNRNDSLVHQPFDFTQHNHLTLQNLQQMLQSVLFPASVPAKQRFRLSPDDRAFLLQYLSQYPSETDDPKYDTTAFYDSYVKFFFRDSTRRMPAGVRVFNKVGWSYGFLTDVSYVADFINKVEYMLAATLYVNSDEVLNDGKYEYNTIGYPFLYRLGQTIYQVELTRPRRYDPDLSEFSIRYNRRNPADRRPSLRDVDN
jgi:hypothetical protein